MNTWDYIERIRSANGGDACTDYRVSKLIGTSTAAVSNYKSGHRNADDEMATRIADALGLPPLAVIADIRATKAETDGNAVMATIWRNAEAMALGNAPPVVRKVASPAVRVVPLPMVATTASSGGATAPAMKKRRAAGAGRRSVSITDGVGGDGRNRTADLGVMNPSL